MRRCVCGWTAASDLDTCGHYQCELYSRGFGPLELRRDTSGWRHSLLGEDVPCGTSLLLATRDPEVAFVGATLPVRYECALHSDAAPRPLLATYIGGHEAAILGQHHLRLRWPFRAT